MELSYEYQSASPAHDRRHDRPHIGEKTQKNYIRCVKDLAAFTGKPPETATAEDLRLYRVHLVERPPGASSVNAYMSALRFFFGITLGRADPVKCLFYIYESPRLPTVLTQEEVARLLDAAPGAKYKAALSVAYGAGLRASERGALFAAGLSHMGIDGAAPASWFEIPRHATRLLTMRV